MEYSGGVQISDLCVDLKEFHLREVTLEVAAGEYFVLLGPTGSGKTVLLEAIAGLFQPYRGHVLIDGEDVTHIPPEHRGIGFVYQDYVLFPHLDVARNVAFGWSLTGRRGLAEGRQRNEIAMRRVREISRLLSIDHLLHRSPKTLSGGEQQRVALARALMVDPRLLLLDEPLSALDPETRAGLERQLARLHRELGTTTLHVTHDFEEAVALGDRIAIMHEGRIVQVGTPEEIFRRPANTFVAQFVGVRNIFLGTVAEAEGGYRRFTFDPSTATGRGGPGIGVATDLCGAVHASIRPEDIMLSLEPFGSSVQNCYRARIVDIADRGTLVYITVSVPPQFTCVVTRRSSEEMMLRQDKEVHIAFKASAVHVF